MTAVDKSFFESEREAMIARKKHIRETEKSLLKDFPTFMKSPRSKEATPLTQRGIEINAGWLQVLVDLIHELQKIESRHSVIIALTQIKQKFGELRVYFQYHYADPTRVYPDGEDVNPVTSEILTAIDIAMERARTICELCGASPAQLRHRRFMQCLCDSCNEREKKISGVLRDLLALSVSEDDLEK